MYLDEIDLNLVQEALLHKIKTTQWNLEDPDHWEELKAFKFLEYRIAKSLEGEE